MGGEKGSEKLNYDYGLEFVGGLLFGDAFCRFFILTRRFRSPTRLSQGNDFKEVGSLMDGIKRNVLGAFVDEDVQRVKEMCGLGKVWAGWKEGSGGGKENKKALKTFSETKKL